MRMTLLGTAGDISQEGNPIMRAMMESFGPAEGLILEKAIVGVVCFLIARNLYPEIKRDAAWIYKVPSTPWARAWYKRGDRAWIAYVPLYGAALSQLLAALSWTLV